MTAGSRTTGPDRVTDTATAVEVSRERKKYGTTVAVDDVSFVVRQGEIFGILNPNGAGKTAAVECVIGLRSPDSGRIRVLGLDPPPTARNSIRSWARSCGRARYPAG